MGRAVDDDQDVGRLGPPEDVEVDKDSDMKADKDSTAKAGKHAAGTRPGRQSSQVQPIPVEFLDLTAPHPIVVVVAVHVGQRNRPSWQKPSQLTMRMIPNPWQSIRLAVRDTDTPETGYAWVSVDERRCKKKSFAVPSTLAARAGNALAQSMLAARW